MENSRSFREAPVWQAAFELSTEIYRMTDDWPPEEVRGIAGDLREAAIVAASKIAAAVEVDALKESMNYAEVARESLSLLRTYLYVAEGLGLMDEETRDRLMDQRDEAARLLREMERTMPKEKTDFDARDWYDLPSSSN